MAQPEADVPTAEEIKNLDRTIRVAEGSAKAEREAVDEAVRERVAAEGVRDVTREPNLGRVTLETSTLKLSALVDPREDELGVLLVEGRGGGELLADDVDPAAVTQTDAGAEAVEDVLAGYSEPEVWEGGV